MFVGHLAVAFASTRLARSAPLAWFVAAATMLDLLWPVFLILGLEHVRVVPGATKFTHLVFDSYPWSHSLLMVVLWGVVLGRLARWRGVEPRAARLVVAAGDQPLGARLRDPRARHAALARVVATLRAHAVELDSRDLHRRRRHVGGGAGALLERPAAPQLGWYRGARVVRRAVHGDVGARPLVAAAPERAHACLVRPDRLDRRAVGGVGRSALHQPGRHAGSATIPSTQSRTAGTRAGDGARSWQIPPR